MSGAENVPPPASYQTVYTQQPAGFGDRFGATPGAGAPGITVRPLRDTQEDADFAGRLVVDAFRGKIVYAAGERKYVHGMRISIYLSICLSVHLFICNR